MKYMAHIFDVDDNGSIITSTETVDIYESKTEKQALEVSERLRTSRDINEPLKSGEQYICNTWELDDENNMIKQL